MISRKKLLIICITFLMVILLSNLFTNIFSFTTTTYKPKYGVTTSKVNLRKIANLELSSVVSSVPNNEKVKLLGEIESFYIVQLKNNKVGLISKDFVKVEGDNLEDSLTYESITPYYATVNSDNTNVRSGPATTFATYGKLAKSTPLQVIGKINDFNLIITADNLVGMLRQDLITKSENQEKPEEPKPPEPILTNEQKEILDLINAARMTKNLPALQIDPLLNIVATQKADDMVQNNYFSHDSKTYGTPFEMMKKAGISYKTAGENIAGNPSIKNAVDSWLSSAEHNKNIFSNAYNYIGIGTSKSPTYGNILVTMFIGK